MNPERATPEEERLAYYLEGLYDALAAGVDPNSASLPSEIRPRLDENLDYVRRLRALWSSGACADLAAPTPTAPPQTDGYELKQMHATGGIGQVWLAHDADLNREVAL